MVRSLIMKIENSIFFPGVVKYNTYNIDFNKSLARQKEELNEDLIQVEFQGGYILDIGWFPEYNEKGGIIIQLIQNYKWETPIYKQEVKDLVSLYQCIENVLKIIKDQI